MTLIELVLCMAMLSVFMLVGYGMLQMADKVFKQVSGNEDATMQLKRSVRMLQKDLVTTNVLNVTVTNVTASLPGGAVDGSAVCMLSAAANGTGDMVTKVDGEPMWQRNILYYVVVPLGDPCQGGADANGYDDRCPHKALIRKIIDVSPDTADEQNATVGGFLTRPAGRTDISNLLGEAGVTQVELVGRGMVSMQVGLGAPNLPNEITLMLSTFNAPKTSKLALGTVALTGQPGYLVNALSIFPRNNR